MREKKTRVGGIRTLRVGRTLRVREEVKCFFANVFLQNLLLNFQAGALLLGAGTSYGGNQRNQRNNETCVV